MQGIDNLCKDKSTHFLTFVLGFIVNSLSILHCDVFVMTSLVMRSVVYGA
jgi:hypothetical protein